LIITKRVFSQPNKIYIDINDVSYCVYFWSTGDTTTEVIRHKLGKTYKIKNRKFKLTGHNHKETEFYLSTIDNKSPFLSIQLETLDNL